MLFPQVPPPILWLAAVVAVFIVKHVIADFLLQADWMALGKERATGWFPALSVHAAVHAVFTGAIAFALAPGLVWLAAVDLVVHGAIDRSKSVVGRRLGVEPSTRVFWWLIGIDQGLHQITHLGFAVLIAAA